MIRSKHLSILCCCLLLTSSVSAESYTLAELINRVLTENYQVQIVANNVQIAENNNTLGNAGFLPQLDVQASQTYTVSDIRQELSNGDINTGDNAQSSNTSASAELSWTVFDGFRMFAMKKQLGHLESISQMDAKYYVQQTVADIINVYNQILKERQLLKNYQEAVLVSRFRYNLEAKKKELGASTGLLYNQAKTDYFTDSATVIEQQYLIKNLAVQVNQLINNTLDDSVILKDTLSQFYIIPAKEVLVQDAIDANYELKRALLEEMIAESNIKVQQAARFPEVDLFANYTYSRQVNQVGFLKSNQNVGPAFGVRVRLNLYDGGNTNRLVKNANIARENANLSKKDTKQLIEGAVLQAYYQYQSGMLQIGIAKQRVEAALTSLEIAREQYKAGAINGFDFRQSQISVLTAKNIVAELQYSTKVAETELYRLSGTIVEKTMK